jgi:hypothetical protein
MKTKLNKSPWVMVAAFSRHECRREKYKEAPIAILEIPQARCVIAMRSTPGFCHG